MPETRFADRHVAVLGASTGIGLATARVVAAGGARVTIGGRHQARLEAAREQVERAVGNAGDVGAGAVAAVVVDAEQPESLRRFFSQVGPITDLVVTVTRRGGAGPVAELPDVDLLGAFAGKTVAHLHAVALALPSLAPHGSITLVTAGSAQSALPGTVGLAAVNGALEAAVPPLAAELAPRRVNAVSPGVVETEWWSDAPEDVRRDAFAAFAQRALVRRNGRAEDVALAIGALVENGFLTGVVLPCDGGLRLT